MAEKDNTRKSKSQEERILRHLMKGKHLTALDAVALFDCFRLQARIFDLREKGYNIKTEYIYTNKRKRIARYYMDAEQVEVYRLALNAQRR